MCQWTHNLQSDTPVFKFKLPQLSHAGCRPQQGAGGRAGGGPAARAAGLPEWH